uniref:Secreted protein n=1 Tax=Syphacia muris TaxID=451379 RepID=A0A0N5AVE2_9BILA
MVLRSIFIALAVLSCSSFGDEVRTTNDLNGLKELTSEIGDKIYNLTRQQISDLSTVMKQEESVLECRGKQYVCKTA